MISSRFLFVVVTVITVFGLSELCSADGLLCGIQAGKKCDNPGWTNITSKGDSCKVVHNVNGHNSFLNVEPLPGKNRIEYGIKGLESKINTCTQPHCFSSPFVIPNTDCEITFYVCPEEHCSCLIWCLGTPKNIQTLDLPEYIQQ
eukprot:TRINITY_DN1593_c0_g1_i1.p1 TRINITY_DN1593_c0_g1~~TRINITY_DN1593_c0_g1_i1.p1  ORF type:complete len:145 (-),score=1.64 TRINITY_DN1593_c0_g1_i1:119-553(-)